MFSTIPPTILEEPVSMVGVGIVMSKLGFIVFVTFGLMILAKLVSCKVCRSNEKVEGEGQKNVFI